jgi:hypothetical protein
MLVQISRESIPPDLSAGISNLLQPAQAEVLLGQLSAYLASLGETDQWQKCLLFLMMFSLEWAGDSEP